MNIAVIGTGYVGLVAGTCFAETGHDVICMDSDTTKVEKLMQADIPIYEPGLEELVKRNITEGRLTFTTDLNEAVDNSLIIFIAVGTPPGANGEADLTSLLGVVKHIGQLMKSYRIIVTKSTVPVGTGDRIAEIMHNETKERFDIVSNPEFLKEGAAIDDFMRPDRVVLGVSHPAVAEIMKDIYSPFLRTGNPILVMDLRSAEMTKYASNCLLATKISFINELAGLAERVGADINQVRQGLTTDSRIGPHFLFPGAGFGGSCFPKDLSALVSTGDSVGYDMDLVKTVERVNARQKEVMLQKVLHRFGEDLTGKKFAVWGLAFKPRTDDMREAPAIVIINGLLQRGAQVSAFDPVAMDNAAGIFGDRIKLAGNAYEALENTDALLLVTEWNEFRQPNFERMHELMRTHLIIDGRNIYNPKLLADSGFEYQGIGRPATSPKS
jgi:UDPglucose 6-dehydrogenase